MPDPLKAKPSVKATDPESASREINDAFERLSKEVHKVIVGQDEVLAELLMAMFCGGHALVVGVPGLAKTLLISTLARTLSLGFSRIQFTPDLMPSDMTGTEVIEEDRSTGSRELRFVKGPIFSNVILADEINRTPPKTQAALLEAMQERQVTAGGVRHPLPQPFFVLATQNPIEQEGTYPLPEAQLDRFLLKIQITYPDEAQEVQLVEQVTRGQVGDALNIEAVEPVAEAASVCAMQAAAAGLHLDERVIEYAVRIARATRDWAGVALGAGPRGGLALIRAARAYALVVGRDFVTPDDVKFVALPALRHRIQLSPEIELEGERTDDVLHAILAHVDAPRL